jgi:hypothetical protein
MISTVKVKPHKELESLLFDYKERPSNGKQLGIFYINKDFGPKYDDDMDRTSYFFFFDTWGANQEYFPCQALHSRI